MIFKELKELREEIMRLKRLTMARLNNELVTYKIENINLKCEIESLKPILDTPNLKPAVSSRCDECKEDKND